MNAILQNENLTIDELIKKYEYLVDITLARTYGNIEKFAKSRQIEVDDLRQFGRLGIFKALTTYQKEKYGHLSFRSFIIRNIKWKVNRELYYVSKSHARYKSRDISEDNIVPVISMSYTPHSNKNDRTYYDIISQDYIDSFGSRFPDPQATLVDNLMVKRMLSKLEDKDRVVVEYRLQGLTYEEIGKKVGMTKQGVGMKMKKLYEKYKDYFYAEVTT
jgi:RNA polymerase sigma factor (sigma-70 family)